MSYLMPFILFFFGVLLWRQQLSAKRRFEVAEQVLAAFYKASDALSTLRNPIIAGGEIEAAQPKKDEPEYGEEQEDELPRTKSEEQEQRERRTAIHNVYVARAQSMSPAFGELRTAQILAEIHFGRNAANAMDTLFRARQQVFSAISGCHGSITGEYFPTDELREQHRQFEVSMNRLLAEHRSADGTPDDTDELSKRIDAARTTLESICRPALADPWWLTVLRR